MGMQNRQRRAARHKRRVRAPHAGQHRVSHEELLWTVAADRADLAVGERLER